MARADPCNPQTADELTYRKRIKMKGFVTSCNSLWKPLKYYLGVKVNKVEQEEAERILCNDGCCIGTIDERGFCNVCGKPKVMVRAQDLRRTDRLG